MNQNNLVDKLINATNLISKYNRTSSASYIETSVDFKMYRRFERMRMINKILND